MSRFFLPINSEGNSSTDFFKVDILVKIVKFTSPESLSMMTILIKALLELTLVVNIITVLSCNRISRRT